MRLLLGFTLGAALLAVAGALTLGRSEGATAKRQALGLRTVVAGLDSPVDVTAPRSEPGRLYVVEQSGRIRVVVSGKLRAKPFLDIRPLVLSGGEQGLLSVALHPNYAKNRRFYVDYTDRNGDTRVVEYRADRTGARALPATRRQLFAVNQPYPNHNGGQLAFGPDGQLYCGMGDGGSGGDPENRAQNLSSLLGKLLRIDPVRRGARPVIAAYGLRNPWRFSFDRTTGDLWIGDVGQNMWEEIDHTSRVSPGLENYGWDVYEGNAIFEDKPPDTRGTLVKPVFVYGRDQGYSVTGGFVYRGSAFPALKGQYVFGDYGSGKIWTLTPANGSFTPQLQAITVPGLSSFGEDAKGELYAVSVTGGRLYRIVGR
jgi:glucose/arabinose dehydrogenase